MRQIAVGSCMSQVDPGQICQLGSDWDPAGSPQALAVGCQHPMDPSVGRSQGDPGRLCWAGLTSSKAKQRIPLEQSTGILQESPQCCAVAPSSLGRSQKDQAGIRLGSLPSFPPGPSPKGCDPVGIHLGTGWYLQLSQPGTHRAAAGIHLGSSRAAVGPTGRFAGSPNPPQPLLPEAPGGGVSAGRPPAGSSGSLPGAAPQNGTAPGKGGGGGRAEGSRGVPLPFPAAPLTPI